MKRAKNNSKFRKTADLDNLVITFTDSDLYPDLNIDTETIERELNSLPLPPNPDHHATRPTKRGRKRG